ncbi:MAG: emp24/gp25L/p24 family protein [Thaumarchaeota archaeon]|nr:emp24/gp25L/p24 family protein [Nitrososphaerota archaeon]
MERPSKTLRVSPLILTLALLLLALVQVVPVRAATVQQCTVNPGEVCTLTFNLNNGDKVSGSISISGASNDVNFYVTNPAGARIYDAGRVTGGTTFSFTADSSGAYILHFDNSFSLLSSKQVTASYDITTGGGGGIPEFPPQLSIVVVVTLLVVASYLLVRRFGTLLSRRPSVTPRLVH